MSTHMSTEVGDAPRQLIQSKLEAPVPRQRVSRNELLELCTGLPRKLTLIRAPAGWGKSTLLADWHALEREHDRSPGSRSMGRQRPCPVLDIRHPCPSHPRRERRRGVSSHAACSAGRRRRRRPPGALQRAHGTAAPSCARAGGLPLGREPRDRRGPLLLSRAPSPDRCALLFRAVPSRRSRLPAYAPAASWSRSTRNDCVSLTRRPTSF